MTDRDALPEISELARWSLRDAKAGFSEVGRRANIDGPRLVMTRGAKPVVVLSADAYLALRRQPPARFSDLLLPGEDFEPLRPATLVNYGPIEIE